jgi:hypothetical protein
MPTRIITDALLRREKPPPKGTRKRITDRHLPAYSAVIHPTGAITLGVSARWVGSGPNYVRHVIAEFQPWRTDMDQAGAGRRAAWDALESNRSGTNPWQAEAAVREQAKAQARQAEAQTVGAILDGWYAAKGCRLVKAREAQRALKAMKELWGRLPADALETSTIAAYFIALAHKTPREAANRGAISRPFFTPVRLWRSCASWPRLLPFTVIIIDFLVALDEACQFLPVCRICGVLQLILKGPDVARHFRTVQERTL